MSVIVTMRKVVRFESFQAKKQTKGMTTEEVEKIVIESGSAVTRAGFAGSDVPRVKIPTIVGKPRHVFVAGGLGAPDLFVGNEAQSKRGMLFITKPVERGLVLNWEFEERILGHVFWNELRVAPEEHPVVLTEAATNSSQNRQKATQIMFETFNAPAFYHGTDATLAALSSGRETAVIVDIGNDVTRVTPVHEVHDIKPAIRVSEIGGRHLTELMAKRLLERSEASFKTMAVLPIATEIKEKLCEVVQPESRCATETVEYELPDGSRLTVGNERFTAPEALFSPRSAGIDTPGLVELISSAIMETEPMLQRALWSNVILCGGTSMIPGLSNRLQEELVRVVPHCQQVNVIASIERVDSLPWIGGSIVASLSSFQDRWIVKDEYDEIGPSIVDWRCF